MDTPSPVEIFPFGFNLSQKDGINETFSSSLRIIEGLIHRILNLIITILSLLLTSSK